MPNPKKDLDKIGKSGIRWLVGCGLLFVLLLPLAAMDDTTELTPDHSVIYGLCLALGALAALIAPFVVWSATETWPIKEHIGFVLFCAFMGFSTVGLVLIAVIDIIEARIDFPPSKTITYPNILMRIDYAVRSSTN